MFMPWATMGALGSKARNCFQTSGCCSGKSALRAMLKGSVLVMEDPADPRNSPIDGILAKGFIDDIGIAPAHIRAEVRALAVTPDLDIENEADRDLLAAGPGLDVNGRARQAGDPIGGILAEGRSARRQQAEERQQDAGGRAEAAPRNCVTILPMIGVPPEIPAAQYKYDLLCQFN